MDKKSGIMILFQREGYCSHCHRGVVLCAEKVSLAQVSPDQIRQWSDGACSRCHSPLKLVVRFVVGQWVEVSPAPEPAEVTAAIQQIGQLVNEIHCRRRSVRV